MPTDPYDPPRDPYGADPGFAPGHAAGYGPGDPVGYGTPDRSEAASKKLAAGLTAILLAGLGVHKFILGYTGPGVIMLATTLLCSTIGACLIFPLAGVAAMGVISVVEGIIYLTKSDEEFYQTYMVGKREWF